MENYCPGSSDVDNNSTDLTAKIAQMHGAKVVFAEKRQIARARNAGLLF
jgi:glycosyltransferase involved in cell wall biosynthesis